MSEQPEQQATPTEVNVEGDAVVNNAPDGGGVDNNESTESTEGSDGGDSK